MNTLDIQGLDAIRPTNVVDYLRSHGWVDTPATNRNVAVYKRETVRGVVQAKVLLDESFGDFAIRMAEVADTLSRLEQRPLWAVINDLLSPPGDNLRFRIDSESAESGTLPIQQSLKLRQGLKNILLAAAHSAIAPQPHFSRLSQTKAVALVAECRERQSERGSYVASILVPVSPPLGELPIEEEFGRRTTRTLFSALQTAESAAGNPDLLMKATDKGVSANFLDALCDMEPGGQRGAIEISINWLRGAPSRDYERPVRLQQSSFRSFKTAATALRELSPLPNTELEGYIIAVRKDVTDVIGETTLATRIESVGEARVRIDFEGENYDSAVMAHKNGTRVRVVGTLKKVGRGLLIENHSGIEVVAEEQ